MNTEHKLGAVLVVIGCGFLSVAHAGDDAKGSGISASFRFGDLTNPPSLTPAQQQLTHVICYDAKVTQSGEKPKVTLTVNANANNPIGHSGSPLKCETWFKSTVTTTDATGKKWLIVAIRADDPTGELDKRKLSVSVSSQAIASVSDVRPPVGAAPLVADLTKKEPSEYFVLWPYELPTNSTTTVSVSITSFQDEKDVAAGTDWMLPVVPVKYHYAIMPGVAVSSIKTRSAEYAAGSTAASFTPTLNKGSPLVDPVLFLAWYPGGVNPSADKAGEFAWVFGASFKSPASNLYIGGSFEPKRNIVVAFGVNAAKMPKLTSAYDPGPSDSRTAPPTVDKFKFGGFLAVGFNFSGFLPQVFGAGK
jgi:hypothetical protein